jgi:hypothetical protein
MAKWQVKLHWGIDNFSYLEIEAAYYAIEDGCLCLRNNKKQTVFIGAHGEWISAVKISPSNE